VQTRPVRDKESCHPEPPNVSKTLSRTVSRMRLLNITPAMAETSPGLGQGMVARTLYPALVGMATLHPLRHCCDYVSGIWRCVKDSIAPDSGSRCVPYFRYWVVV
jgi:hypothetical protein